MAVTLDLITQRVLDMGARYILNLCRSSRLWKSVMNLICLKSLNWFKLASFAVILLPGYSVLYCISLHLIHYMYTYFPTPRQKRVCLKYLPILFSTAARTYLVDCVLRTGLVLSQKCSLANQRHVHLLLHVRS